MDDEDVEKKNLNMCYDNWFKIKIKGKKGKESLEHNDLLTEQSWKTKHGNFSPSATESYCH